MKRITLTGEGISLGADTAGPSDGPVIVLIAGWPQTSHAWRFVLPILADEGFRVIAIDPPGLGASDMLPPDRTADCVSVARVMHGAIQAIGVDHFTLVGHDVGSWISYAWATRYPFGLDRVCLTEAAIPGVAPAGAFGIENAARVFQFFFCALPELPEQLTADREHIFLRHLFDTKMQVRSAISEADLDQYSQSYRRPGRMTAGFAYYRAALATARQNEQVLPPSMPVLAIGGESSVGHALHQALEDRKTPNLRGQLFKNAGHYIPEEAPDLFAQAVLDFIRSS